ncbi:tRNA (adenosine(37)-N6)-threonylcarbamoyltransferase complex dimerization subunit type 1 TsaB [Streptococcus caviae]|uniref:tRNA (adenosine(37)-N6)-threonylcarbamoyltransferase complex dimerization subunit type 1 TsaB n=1 Tax=Streptococcus sp. 'caviae' TaxID=1915004 RepID=UPI00094B9E11|nr:tRNA (adenosine(37)-N6)-threonylcarbamoyltransferase complex dimerization subunit type 1 TsaB [Streptococcus sp. 'caviae']OLN84623.1 tRNA (adenosine(37)-N6)-threonylcarbamoyltransferase complex dimerization subunit type 1 TsaB [Streptococcus sp. 'caviae']
MKILAFDTSSKTMSVALLEEEYLLASMTLNIKKNHSVSLMPAIDFLLKSADLKPADLDRIVVAEGPGSYTGLRVAVATAKTLAYALAIDLVGVSSLQALALSSHSKGLVIPIMDARRRNVYVGFYENGRAVEADRHAALAAVLEHLKGREQVTFVGEVAVFRQEISQAFPEAKVQEVLPSAFKIGQAGQKLAPVDVHSFVPKYLKRVEAEENWLKTHKESGLAYIKRV